MNNNMLEIKTSEHLLSALTKSASKKLTPHEMLEQRVSFVYGSISAASGVTREQVKRVIVEREGGAMECACDSL